MKAEVLLKQFFEGAPRYRWLETLGRGGVGVVFKARDLELDEVVAIKVLSPDLTRDDQETILARFKREINLNRKIKHPNVARMYDFGMSGEYPYITMEFIPGRDLWTIVHEDGRVPPAQAVPILRQIARGTEAVHRLGIVHRDLKSQNILVDGNGAVAILDFGLARATVSESFTLDHIILGTPQYMSPEQASGKPVDSRSDIYSIGIIAFEMLTGTLPFTADSPIAVAMMQISDPIPDSLKHFPEISPALRGIVMRCLEKQPAARFAAASELEGELALLEELPVPDRGVGEKVRREGSPAPPSVPEGARTVSTGLPRPPMQSPATVAAPAALGPLAPPASPVPAAVPEAPPGAPKAVPQAPARPVAPVPAGTVPPQGSVPAPSVSRMSSPRRGRLPVVLLVSSDGAVASQWARVLEGAGCRTAEARGGQEALEALVKKPADLVVMDVALPGGMDGFDVTRIVRSMPNLAGMPVILTAERLERSQFAFGLQSGAHDILSRPVEPPVLVEKVWNALRKRGFAGRGPGDGPPPA